MINEVLELTILPFGYIKNKKKVAYPQHEKLTRFARDPECSDNILLFRDPVQS